VEPGFPEKTNVVDASIVMMALIKFEAIDADFDVEFDGMEQAERHHGRRYT
jgi:hypothetical protein